MRRNLIGNRIRSIAAARAVVLAGAATLFSCRLTQAQTASVPHMSTHAASSPVIVPDERVLRLDDLGLYSLGYTFRNREERFFPIGWSGAFDEATGVACQPAGEQNGKSAWLLHPPWRNGAGATRQTFRFALPQAKRIMLRGAFAMRAQNTGKSDGVTFRVFANNRALLQEHRKATDWREFSFDLTPFAGQTVALGFESDCGPLDDSSFDFALWGNRELVLDGFQSASRAMPTPIDLPLNRLASSGGKTMDGAAPAGGYPGRNTTTLQNGAATLRYDGPDGTYEYSWRAPRDVSQGGFFGEIVLRARMKTTSGQMTAPIAIPLAGDARVTWANGWTMKRQRSRFEKTARGITLVSRWQSASGDVATTPITAEVHCQARLVGKSLVFDVACDAPVIERLQIGSWGPVLRRSVVAVPYYTTGRVWYLPRENLFANAFLDWTSSRASFHDNSLARYDPLTDGTRNLLRERAIFAPAWHLAEVLPEIPNPKSPFLKEMGSKIVLDNWGGKYLDTSRHLENLHDMGVRDAILIVHDWQREGYDNALPSHFPANAMYGGDADMKTLVATATRLGFRIALHENYADYYPNYEGFNARDIALNSDGSRVLAWFHPGTKLQSFGIKPTRMVPLARTQSPEIHRRYHTNANYLDVHSAVAPWWHVDFQAGQKEAGQFSAPWKAHHELWNFERQTHCGPTLGEGANHWFWSGLLDGVEAQVDGGRDVPLFLDFDLLKIHPLQSNHGMGYYERWWGDNGPRGLPPLAVLDRYRMQEIAFGHAGFLGSPTWSDARLAWLEQNLVTPVSSRYATARPKQIRYRINGAWRDSDSLVKALASAPSFLGSAYDISHVTYDNGLSVFVNNGAGRLSVHEYLLPQYGWLAQGAGVTAYTALRDGVVADFAETASTTFANARPASTWDLSLAPRTRVEAVAFNQSGPRAFNITYRWRAVEKFASDYHVFVHFTSASGANLEIVWQDDHEPPTPTSRWSDGQTIEDGPRQITLRDDLGDGDYQMSIGLFDAGGRAQLANMNGGRVPLGVVCVRDKGQTITFVPTADTSPEKARPFRQNVNTLEKVVDFGSVRTNGSVMIRREGSDWVLQTLPRDRPFVLELGAARFGTPRTVQSVGGKTTSVAPQNVSGKTGARWKLPLNGAREYRWTATPHQRALVR